MFKTSRIAEIAIATVLIAGIAGASFAQDAAAVIASRQAFMQGVTRMSSAVSTAAAAGDMTAAKAAAKTLDDGWKAFATQFPAGSDSAAGKTRAKAEIWSNATGFKAEMDKALAASAALVAATNGTDKDAMANAVSNVNGVCVSCHNDFRGPRG